MPKVIWERKAQYVSIFKKSSTKVRAGSVGNEDCSALLGDILQALENQTAGNWPSVRDELIAVVREELAQ